MLKAQRVSQKPAGGPKYILYNNYMDPLGF